MLKFKEHHLSILTFSSTREGFKTLLIAGEAFGFTTKMRAYSSLQNFEELRTNFLITRHSGSQSELLMHTRGVHSCCDSEMSEKQSFSSPQLRLLSRDFLSWTSKLDFQHGGTCEEDCNQQIVQRSTRDSFATLAKLNQIINKDLSSKTCTSPSI